MIPGLLMAAGLCGLLLCLRVRRSLLRLENLAEGGNAGGRQAPAAAARWGAIPPWVTFDRHACAVAEAAIAYVRFTELAKPIEGDYFAVAVHLRRSLRTAVAAAPSASVAMVIREFPLLEPVIHAALRMERKAVHHG